MNTTKEKTYYTDIHQNYELWKSDLAFYKDELAFFKNRLEEIASKNTSKDITPNLEHFQNQFIVQKDVIDRLIHKIHISEDELKAFIKDHPVALDHVRINNNKDLADQMVRFEQLWKDMKKEFLKFISTKM